ncbi:lipopolysaccharide biosynthesis protein [Sutcliffiella horikoshii]|uniref:lipopolysaccharide biosynthesis protein n=1 Tax=Sutcliffiella horikoshii TaxID=79883 RepID=UPI003CED9921
MDSQRKKNPSLTNRTLKGFMWSFSGTFFQILSKFIVLIVLARLLTPEDFGIVNVAMIIISFSMIFSTLGVGPAIVQRPNLKEAHINVGYTISILLGVLITVVVWGLSDTVAYFFNIENLALITRILAVTFFIQSFSIVGQALLERNMEFKRLARIQVISYVFGYGLISILLAVLGSGIWALVYGQIAQSLIQSISILYSQPHSKKINFTFSIFKELMYFGGGFTIARIFNHIALQGDNIIIGKFLGPIALGYYGRAYQLMVMPANVFGQVLDKVLFPAMAKIQDNKSKLNIIFLRGTAVISLIVLPFSIFLLMFAKEVVLVLFGEEWIEIVVPFKLLAIGMLFRASYKVSESVARATGAVYRRAWRQSIYAASVLIGSYIGHFWGLNGVSVGITFAIFINFMLMTHLSISVLKGSWLSFLKIHVPSIIVSLIILLESFILNNLLNPLQLSSLLVLVISGFICLFTVMILFRYFPNMSLGDDGKWVIKLMISIYKKRGKSDEKFEG